MQQLMTDVEEIIRKDMDNSGPYTKIIEEPAPKALRFRYECEGRSAGSIPGINSTRDNKVHPTIQVCNYKGPAVVVVSCVTKDQPYRPHPHKLVGKDGCRKGVCTVPVNKETMTCSFTNLGIQCVKRREIEEALKSRAEIRVDPFRTGFDHKNQAGSIDLNSIRLCFQVFLEGPDKGKFTYPLKPVVSEPIYDKKAMSDLIIIKLSACSAPVSGGTEIILLCDKVAKDNTEVRFFELQDGVEVWQGFGDFHPADVHKQVAISFRTPRYKDQNIQKPVDLFIELRRKKDGATSTPRSFQFIPLDRDPEGLKRKMMKIDSGILSRYAAMPRPGEANVENRNIIHPNRTLKRESEFDQTNLFPTFVSPSSKAPPFSLSTTNLPLYSSALYDSTASQVNPPTEFTISDVTFPLSTVTTDPPPPYSQLQQSPTQSQYSPVQAISPASVTMMAATQSSPAGGSSIVSKQFTPSSIAPSSVSPIPNAQVQSPQSPFKNEGATVHNVPLVQPEQSIDEHMSEKLSSLDLGLRVEGNEMSLPLSEINLSLFESENISLSRLMDGGAVDESNNNIVLNIQQSGNKEDGNSQVNVLGQNSENLITTMSTDSFSKLTSRVNNELDTLNMLSLNVGVKSEMSSS